MNQKIPEILKTASFNPKFTDYKKNVIDMKICVVFKVFVLHRLVTLIIRLID